MKTFLNILYSIFAVIFGVIAAIGLFPFLLIYLMIDIPTWIIKRIWGMETDPDD